MFDREENFSSDAGWIEEMVRSVVGAQLDHAAQQELAARITRYAQRQRVSLSRSMIARIVAHYERDHPRVMALHADTHDAAWKTVLGAVARYAAARSKRALDAAELDELSRQVLAAIRHDLDSYSFEAALDDWLTVRTARCLSRLWRNR